ncbi:hypothetical protein [Methylobacterium nigriterrae]|uniref:hypothetical protein n=1 Tax=Methylobacterium nigriterrae TaxID=3127512 RepID=UPI0030140333
MRRILNASSEREAALMAEATLRQIHEVGEPIGFSVEAPDPDAVDRIADYLDGVIAELDATKR